VRTSLCEGYVFLVTLVSMAGALVCVFGGLYAAIGVVCPDWLMRDPVWALHQSNDQFWDYKGRAYEASSGWLGRNARPPEEELTRRRLESYEVEKAAIRRDSWVMLVMYGVGVAISLVMFAGHWRLARTFRPPPRQPGPAG
jgi:hypothetical protein